MTQTEITSSTAYIDMVRNHREKAFDEGVKVLWKIIQYYLPDEMEDFNFPENPYKINQKGERNEQKRKRTLQKNEQKRKKTL